jgi:hypothetical protein
MTCCVPWTVAIGRSIAGDGAGCTTPGCGAACRWSRSRCGRGSTSSPALSKDVHGRPRHEATAGLTMAGGRPAVTQEGQPSRSGSSFLMGRCPTLRHTPGSTWREVQPGSTPASTAGGSRRTGHIAAALVRSSRTGRGCGTRLTRLTTTLAVAPVTGGTTPGGDV